MEGYACLYKSYGETVDAVSESGITITLIRDAKPLALFGYFKEHGYQVSNPHNGIYYIKGNIPFPAQIVVTRELNPKLHIWLRALSGRLDKQDMKNLLEQIRQLTGKQNIEFADAVLEVALRANVQIIKELMGDVGMSEELLEIVKPIIEPHILLREQNALEKGIIKGAVDILRDIGRGDSEIKTIIMNKYNLTEKDASEYV